jgi:hypothetical protein
MQQRIEEVFDIQDVKNFGQIDAKNIPNIYLINRNDIWYFYDICSKKTVYEFEKRDCICLSNKTSDPSRCNCYSKCYYQYPYLLYASFNNNGQQQLWITYIKYDENENKFDIIYRLEESKRFTNYSIIQNKLILYYCDGGKFNREKILDLHQNFAVCTRSIFSKIYVNYHPNPYL